jgi:hypothetical protein
MGIYFSVYAPVSLCPRDPAKFLFAFK